MEARNYEYLYPEEYAPNPKVNKRVLKKQRKYIKVKSRSKAKAKARARAKSRQRSLVVLGALNILLSICLLYTYVTSTVLTGKIANVKKEIEGLEATRDYYSMEIDKYSSVERIEQIAKYKLGMVYPNEDQIFYIEKGNGSNGQTSLANNSNEK